jgi:hypothetical protein
MSFGVKGLITFVYKTDYNKPVGAQSKTWLCGRSFAGVAGSNLAGGVDVYLL